MINNFLRFIPFSFIGFSSGLTILVLFSVDIWLARSGVSKTIIGLLSVAKIPYVFKFLTVPFIEKIHFSKLLPPKKSWILASHAVLFLCLLVLSIIENPAENLTLIFLTTTILMLANSVQNITAYAFQMYNTPREDVGFVTTYLTVGYRIGVALSNALVLMIAAKFSWNSAFISLGIISFCSSFIFFTRDEPILEQKKSNLVISKILKNKNISMIKKIFFEYAILPLKYFRKSATFWYEIIIVLTLKIPDDMCHKMAKLMYLDVGFTPVQIAKYVNLLGTVAVIFGGIIVGNLLKKRSISSSILITATIHSITNLFYLIVLQTGSNEIWLFATILLENVTGGMMMTAFLSFIYETSAKSPSPSFLYGLLWAIYNIGGIFSSSCSGILVEKFGWSIFFISTFAISLLTICFVFCASKKFPKNIS